MDNSFNKFLVHSHYISLHICLDLRRKVGSPFKAVKFNGSPHVGHLRYHKKKYTEEVIAFINNGKVERKTEKLDEKFKMKMS